jgi:hypothetical protein
MRWELDGHSDGVNHLAEHSFSRCPGCIAFSHLLHRCWLLPVRIIRVLQLAKYLVEGMQEDSLDVMPTMTAALDHPNEVVQIYVLGFDRLMGTSGTWGGWWDGMGWDAGMGWAGDAVIGNGFSLGLGFRDRVQSMRGDWHVVGEVGNCLYGGCE